MVEQLEPRIGDWYKNMDGDLFEVVALNDQDDTVDVQFFDGTVEEFDLDTWHELNIAPSEPPEDWSGSLDIEREDYGVDPELPVRENSVNPLDKLED